MMHSQFTKIFLLLALSALAVVVNAASYTTIDKKTLEIDFSAPKQPTLLIFWASWCPGCKAEIPNIKDAFAAYPDIHFVGINVNRNVKDGLHVQTIHDLPYPSISDPTLSLTHHFHIRGTPGFILLDSQGKEAVRTRFVNRSLKLAMKTLSVKVVHGTNKTLPKVAKPTN